MNRGLAEIFLEFQLNLEMLERALRIACEYTFSQFRSNARILEKCHGGNPERRSLADHTGPCTSHPHLRCHFWDNYQLSDYCPQSGTGSFPETRDASARHVGRGNQNSY